MPVLNVNSFLHAALLSLLLQLKLFLLRVQVKQELEDKVQRTQDELAKQIEATNDLQTQLTDAAAAAEAAQAQSDEKLAAGQLELSQIQDTVRMFPLMPCFSSCSHHTTAPCGLGHAGQQTTLVHVLTIV